MTSVIMPAGQAIPGSRCSEAFAITSDGQTAFDIPIMELEERLLDDADAKVEPTANFRFFCTPNAKEGDPIRVTLGYDEEGGVYAKAEDANSGCSLSVEERPYREPNLGGVRVSIKPRWIVFALDTSGSMDEDDKIGAAKTVLVEKADEMIALGADSCKVGVVTFGDGGQCVCPPTDDAGLVESSIAGITTGGSGAMAVGLRMAEELLRPAPASAERLIVIMAGSMIEDADAVRQVADLARSKGIVVLAIGIGRGLVDEEVLNDIADDFGVVDFSSEEECDTRVELLSMVNASKHV